VTMDKIAPESMILRVFEGIRCIDPGVPLPSGGGVCREQLVIFLADTLRGTAEERAPLVIAMSHGTKMTATTDQIRAFLEDLISAVVQTLTHRGRLRGWRPDHMGDSAQGVKLLAEQLSSELKPLGYMSGYLTDSPVCTLQIKILHGESFTRLVGNCKSQGPSVLLVKDTKGHIFGGFASHSWEIKPPFQGDSRCFLFSVYPYMQVFTCTGYNQHYMYLNQGQQTMPNGLGMGGQHGYFGLWLDCDFGRGHSRARPRCTTYGSPQLSGDEDFTLDTVEVWGIGLPPKEQEQDENKKSILDVDPEAQILLEMAGKSMHSQGLREPEDED
ncbi:hypothetical protein P4O66_018471, partial [Electrophorus voltai]